MKNFIAEKGNEIKAKIMKEAKYQLLKVDNIRKVREKEERDKKIMKEKEARHRAEGKITEDKDEESIGWVRGTAKPDIPNAPKKEEREVSEVFLKRSAMGISKPEIEEKNDDGLKRPTFSKQLKQDNGGEPITQAGFGSGFLYANTSS